MKSMADNVANVSTGFRNLSSQVETSLNVLKIEKSNAPSIPTAPSFPSNVPNPCAPPAIPPPGHFFTNKPLPQLPYDVEGNTNHWFQKVYNSKRRPGREGGADDLGPGQKEKILLCYMEDENGKEVPASTKDSVRRTARGFFELLLENGRAPSQWGNAPLDVQNEYLHIMESAHPFLCLCQDHWKATKVATNSYSQWLYNALRRTKNVVAKVTPNDEAIDIDSNEDSDEDSDGKALTRIRDEEEADPRPSKRPRVQENQPTPAPRPRSKKINPQRPKVCKQVHIRCTLH